MRAVIFGSTGNVSKPLATKLAKDGVETVVITRSSNKADEIKAFGAIPAIGDIDDVEFLLKTFEGANCIFVNSPLPYTQPNIVEVINKQMEYITDIILQSKVPNVVYLSSIGAHRPGIGGLEFHYYNEQILKNKLSEVLNSLTFVRPAKFYSNLLVNLNDAKKGTVYSFLDIEKVHSYVSLDDIADIISEIIEHPPTNKLKVINIESERITIPQIRDLFAKVFNQPELKWEYVPVENTVNAMVQLGLKRDSVDAIFESLAPPLHDEFHEDFFHGKTEIVKGNRTVEDYIKNELKPIYDAI